MKRNIEVIAQHYLMAVLFTECGPDAEFSGDDPMSQKALDSITADCAEFVKRAGDLLCDDWSDEQTGHDLWLTRNGHGAGFWDRGLTNGDNLSVIAHTMGTRSLYLGDDGFLYFDI